MSSHWEMRRGFLSSVSNQGPLTNKLFLTTTTALRAECKDRSGATDHRYRRRFSVASDAADMDGRQLDRRQYRHRNSHHRQWRLGIDAVPLISHAQYMDVDAGFTTKIDTISRPLPMRATGSR